MTKQKDDLEDVLASFSGDWIELDISSMQIDTTNIKTGKEVTNETD